MRKRSGIAVFDVSVAAAAAAGPVDVSDQSVSQHSVDGETTRTHQTGRLALVS